MGNEETKPSLESLKRSNNLDDKEILAGLTNQLVKYGLTNSHDFMEAFEKHFDWTFP